MGNFYKWRRGSQIIQEMVEGHGIILTKTGGNMLATFKSLRVCLGEGGLDVFCGAPGVKSRIHICRYWRRRGRGRRNNHMVPTEERAASRVVQYDP